MQETLFVRTLFRRGRAAPLDDQGPRRPTTRTGFANIGRTCRVRADGRGPALASENAVPHLTSLLTAVVQVYTHSNDPSAGSPTETLLRLLLPLNHQVRSTSASQM